MDTRKMIINFGKDNSNIEAFQFINSDPDGVSIKMITGQGVANYVYRISSLDGENSIIAKYSEETMRGAPDIKMNLDRQTVEYNALCLMNKLVPGSAPRPYCLDNNYHILAMEDMKSWELLGGQLERRHVDLEAPTHFGWLLGQVHYKTSQNNMSKEDWENLKEKFSQAEYKEFMRQFSIEKLFDENDPVCCVPEVLGEENVEAFRNYVKELQSTGVFERFNEIYAPDTCFIHPDCHYKSIFTKQGKVALFDFEAAFMGHPGYDLGEIMCCYPMMYIVDKNHHGQTQTGPTTSKYKVDCLQAMRKMLEAYLESDKNTSRTEAVQKQFIEDLTLFTGVFIWLLGMFKEMDQIVVGLDRNDRREMIDLSVKVMKTYRGIHTVDDFISLLSQDE